MTLLKSFLFVVSTLSLWMSGLLLNPKSSQFSTSYYQRIGSDTIPKNDHKDPYDNYTDWAIYRGDKKSNQYAELAQIHAANVHLLEPAWEYHTGDPNGPSMYSNPIIVEGLIYFTTPKLNAIALDATTGKEVWVFESAQYHEDQKVFRGRSRGVTYWEGEEGKRIFHFVNNRVYALDAKTGTLIKSFGENGFIDLRKDLSVDVAKASIEVTTPGIIYKNFLIVTSRVPEEYNSTPGHVRAFDAVTGEFKWIFHTIPQEGEFGYDTWEWVEGETYGGANPWGGFSVDEERGWVFFATGSPANDFYGGFRKGTNLFGNSVVALDATTGKRIWHYQTVHHDIWDYDNPPAPILVTLNNNGKTRDAVVQLTKMGFTFVLDRDTGEPLFPVEEVPVPASKIPGEEAWPTQPFPLKPPPLVRTSLTEADLTNVTPESRTSALEQFRRYETGHIYTPPSLQGMITMPSHQGGVEWGGASFDPALNVLYVNANEAPSINTLSRFYDTDNKAEMTMLERGALVYQKNCTSCHGLEKQGNLPTFPALTDLQQNEEEIRNILRQGQGIMPSFPQLSKDEIDAVIAFVKSNESIDEENQDARSRVRYSVQIPFFLDPYGAPAISPPWGTLNAIDLNEGKILWKVPLGEYPELVAKGIRHTGAKNFGGPVATAGGVTFIAATPDEKIRAFSSHSGEVLWEYQLPAGGYATPSVYMINGKQYVVIAAGGGGKNATKYGDSIIAFALPASEDTESNADDENKGWINLFNGKDLEGWVHLNGSHTYTVEDSSIVGRTVKGSQNSFLCTTQEFDDFELELEMMVDSVTNSGIQIRSQVKPVTEGEGYNERAGRVYGPQVEMQRNHRPGTPTTGLIYGEALGTGWLSSDDKIQNGHHYLHNEGWNTLRIVAKGSRIQTWVNGQQVEDLVNEEVYQTHSKGFIGLQMHGMEDEGLYVMKWRNMRIRTL
ncbi:family 16 glycoside hydrolase [Catalinimonas niigatensis]|uniref:family 16 glycoside hydrolase n=1 Tax=Catalinimonas niigatensis TaxID=1397264 RepID=UPI002666CEED|nr:family 16 glycoside hydrolase [Catalinimonas niigatensis]WPP50760.1 family 16 glycoside hydrolase [Catalinimonas niigatensis]